MSDMSGKYDHKHECQHGHPHDGRCECVCGYEAWSASKSPNGQAEEWAFPVAPIQESPSPVPDTMKVWPVGVAVDAHYGIRGAESVELTWPHRNASRVDAEGRLLDSPVAPAEAGDLLTATDWLMLCESAGVTLSDDGRDVALTAKQAHRIASDLHRYAKNWSDETANMLRIRDEANEKISALTAELTLAHSAGYSTGQQHERERLEGVQTKIAALPHIDIESSQYVERLAVLSCFPETP